MQICFSMNFSIKLLATITLHKAQKIVCRFKVVVLNSLFKSLYKTAPEAVSPFQGTITGENTCRTSFSFPPNSLINTRMSLPSLYLQA